MIRVKLIGGIGNQLFQFAFAYILSRKLNTSFVLDTWLERFRLDAFRLNRPFALLRVKAISKLYTKVQKRFSFKRTVMNLDCTQTVADHTLLNDTDYIGFFQDGSIYEPHKAELQKLFRVRKKYTKRFYEKYGQLLDSSKILVVHVRAGDYRVLKLKEYGDEDILLPVNWYLEQLGKVRLDDYKCYIITNEIEYVQKEFSHYPQFQFVNDDALNDFQLLQHADVAIISNSTFAWWASFLNVKSNPRIIAPKFFLGYHAKKEFPAGIQNVNFEWA